ncbi:MAG: hypothetical protein ACD_68C00046G0003 [uncultured bacterium]|nr:MAG: hypothetical protein ACD_68C00046G0003 [uncultured bacterium]
MFTHLHVHSHYSLLDGLPKIGELIAAAKNNNFSALALTEHGNMYSAIEFYQAAKKAGIKPILGCELYLARGSHLSKQSKIDASPYHLTILCENLNGYQNLVKLITISNLEGFYYKPRVDLELLEKYHDGLIALSGCRRGQVSQSLENGDYDGAKQNAAELQKLFGRNNFYLEIQRPANDEVTKKLNDGLVKLSRELNIPLVATNDVHYLYPADKEVQDILVCIQTQKTINDPNRLTMMDSDLSLKSEGEMKELFADLPEAVEESNKIAEKCNVEIELGKVKLPYYEVPADSNHNDYLRDLCRLGLKKRYPDLLDSEELTTESSARKQAILDRFEYEMSVIENTGFAGYFLIVQDFVNFAKNNNIVVGPGRGSAAGSIVSYVLNITDLDPIKYDLVFERFLNPERISLPDIDIDFADNRRDEVIQYVSEKYGHENVAQIITFGTMAARAAVRDTGRVLGFPYAYCDRIAKLIPMFFSLEKALNTVSELKEMYDADPQAKRLLDLAIKLEGVARHASTHACGVVITKEPIDTYMPRQFASASDKTIVSQYSLHPVEDMGLLKMDFLGLKNLTIIERALKIISRNQGVEIELSKIPLDDKSTFKLFQRATTTGVFQLESPGMKRYLKMLKPTNIEDIIAMVALYRPGPMELIPDYIAGKHGKKVATYLHPKLEPILAKTFGIAVYQEQVLQIARDLAGFTLGEADILRKAVGKKIASLLAEQKEKFIDGCVKNGITQTIASKIFAFIEPFAGYGFNRAHAACYAVIAYQTAYLKAHYPAEFMASLLTSDLQDIDRVAIEVSECEQIDIPVLPPNVNESYGGFTVIKTEDDQEAIRFGLEAIKNVGSHITEIIVAEHQKQPFANLEDFISRIPADAINKKSLESLIKCGAMDSFGERNQMLENLDRLLKFSRSISKDRLSKQGNIFAVNGSNTLPKLHLAVAPEAPKKQKLAWEKELLGLYVTEHPIEEFKPYLEKIAIPIGKIIRREVLASGEIIISGIITRISRIVTKNNEPMLFVTLEDDTASLEVLVFPSLYQKTAEIWQVDNAMLVSGKISTQDAAPKILANKAKKITLEELQKKSLINNFSENHNQAEQHGQSQTELPFVISVPPYANKEMFAKLKEILKNSPGNKQVVLKIPTREGKYKEIVTSLSVAKSEDLTKKIEHLVGQGTIN